MTEYVGALKKVALHCAFGPVQSVATSVSTTGTSTQAGAGESPGTAGSSSVPAYVNVTVLPMDVMLRDRVVCGLRGEHLPQLIFAERDLTFLKVFDIPVRAENARDYQRRIKAEFRAVNKADPSRPVHQRHEEAPGVDINALLQL